ncbi:MAG: hypothetical protein QOF54_1934, partial [Solirubrobacteraceae bacterium]|nr:hypothetical protein [Solirubrobacteraceae bacterium]
MSPRISIRLLAGQSDQRLVALAREGHERAFEALVHRYRRPLLRYCRRLRLSDARAEDVLQQAFLQAWLALGRGVDVRELKPWLYRIVHNAAVNAMRGPLESHAQLSDAPLARAALARESELERRVALRDALADVAALPRLQQQAIFLTAVDGQTHDEVASALGISHGALRGLLYRARSSLRSAAAALTPPQLVAWAAGRAGGTAGSPSGERLAELATGAGGAGLVGATVKAAAIATTAAIVASGAAGVGSPADPPHRPPPHARSARSGAPPAAATGAISASFVTAGAPATAAGGARGASNHAADQTRGDRRGETRRSGTASSDVPSHEREQSRREGSGVSRGADGSSAAGDAPPDRERSISGEQTASRGALGGTGSASDGSSGGT